MERPNTIIGREVRYLQIAELRTQAATDKEPRKLIGYAAMFNKPSEPLPIGGGRSFIERIKPGAFTRCLGQDVRCLVNHDPNLLLGRTSSRTLTLFQDELGLRMECTPPDNSYARDLLNSIDRGDMNQMSFAFNVADDGDDWSETDQVILREIREFSNLYDVSPVTYAAYLDTTIAARSLNAALAKIAPQKAGKVDPLLILRQKRAEIL